jgi:PTH1 family peptidyl-tRNA hydrolase
VGDGTVYLIQPLTYVNRSGAAVLDALQRFEADPDELFVICDDYHLPLGALRIRKRGSSGGHNGLLSIIEALGRDDFARLRLGIGPLPDWADADREKIPDFVLGRFEADDEEIVTRMLSLAVEAVAVTLRESLDMAISTCNRNNPTPDK